jgi:propionate CoA-transferase
LFITERAVFELQDGVVTLTEVAPGIRMKEDILAHMGFAPRISPDLKPMDAGLFQPKWGGLRKILESKRTKAAVAVPELTTV